MAAISLSTHFMPLQQACVSPVGPMAVNSRNFQGAVSLSASRTLHGAYSSMHVSTRIGGPSERVAPSLPIVLGSFEVALEAASLTSLFAAEDGEFGLVEF